MNIFVRETYQIDEEQRRVQHILDGDLDLLDLLPEFEDCDSVTLPKQNQTFLQWLRE